MGNSEQSGGSAKESYAVLFIGIWLGLSLYSFYKTAPWWNDEWNQRIRLYFLLSATNTLSSLLVLKWKWFE